MNIKSFQYFTTIVDKPTLSAAAEELFISQSALSQQIKKIEEEMGAPLFERNGHTMTITPAGEVFLRGSHKILQIYESTKREIQITKTAAQETVHFGISPFYSQHYLPKLLPSFLSQHPEIKVELIEDISSVLEQKLLEGELDFCAIPIFPQNELLEYETIYQEEILLAIPRRHPLNDYYSYTTDGHHFPVIDVAMLKNESFIGLKKVQKFSHLGMRICEEAGFVPNTLCETMNWETAHMLIANGLGVGFIPKILVGSITDPELTPCYYQLPSNVYRAYAIAKRAGSLLPPHALALIDCIRETFRKM